MRHLLLHPPFSDPTQPYLSLPTLKAWLKERGLDALVIDLNVEAAHWLLAREQIEQLAVQLGLRFLKLNAQDGLDFDEQREYRQIVAVRKKIEHVLAAEPGPIDVFRDPERFYDAAQYALARRHVEMYFEALSAACYPFRFDFNHAGHTTVPWSFDLLETYCRDQHSPLHAFYEKVFTPVADWEALERGAPSLPLEEVVFAGISVVFPSQIPEALYLARFLKKQRPELFVAVGGPCVHQIAVHLEPASKRRLLGFVDAIGLFEGEETLAQLLPRLGDWRSARTPAERSRLLADVPNLLSWDGERDAPQSGPRHTLDLRESPAPDYSDLDLDRYLSPSRTLLYAPTRGCYWGKCSFCYYGLTETATAAYREVPPERAAQDLARLSRRHGVRHFYLSCDVLSPSYAVRFAQALLDRNLKIRWSCDLKIEKFFTEERCRLLHESGLRAAAFGIESGSDRILDLMRKGCDRATMTAVNRWFHDAGVATEWMTFTDHPDETVEEALETVDWLRSQMDHVDLFIVGEFGLENGSHIAQDPLRYGVSKIYFAAGDDLRLYALFEQRLPPRSPEQRARIDRAIEEIARHYAQKPYPWAGANSTHHSFLHFVKYGPSAFKTHFQRAHREMYGQLDPPPPSHLSGLKERPRFSLDTIEHNEKCFFEQYYARALYTTLAARRTGTTHDVAPLSLADYRHAAAQVHPVRR